MSLRLRSSPAFIAGAMSLVLRVSAAEPAAKTFGSAFLEPDFSEGSAPQDVVRLRYHCEVAENHCSTPEMWKIIFVFHFFRGPDASKTYELQSNLYSWRFAYPHLTRRRRDGEIPGLTVLPGETGMFLSVPDNHKDRRVGARTRSALRFPTLDQEIDGFADLWKREQVSQANLTGKEVTVEIARGGLAEDLRGWNVHESPPAGKFRVWTIHAAWEGQSQAVDFALPDESAQFYAPGRMMQIATEAFAIHPGRFRALFWNFEFQRAGSESWEPLRNWKVVGTDALPAENTWGMKGAMHHGHRAIEVSNSGERVYAGKGDRISLD